MLPVPVMPANTKSLQSPAFAANCSSLNLTIPCAPIPSFNYEKLPTLLTPSIYKSRIVPWCDPALGGASTARPDDVPPYSLSLESYYRMFHPSTWVVLETEYSAQKRYLLELEELVKKMREGGAYEGHLTAIWSEWDRVKQAMWLLYSRLYGLHFLRDRYLNFYRLAAPMWDDHKILHETLELERPTGCKVIAKRYLISGVSEHTIWPLPLPLTVIPSTLSRKGLICIANFSSAALYWYRLPRFRPEYLDEFCAVSLDNLRQAYEQDSRKLVSAAPVEALFQLEGPSSEDGDSSRCDSNKPSGPEIRIDMRHFPDLISKSAYLSRLAPWANPDIAAETTPLSEQEVPPWSLSLESCYAMYHPDTWTVLGEEYEAHKGYLLALSGWEERRIAEGADKKERKMISGEKERVLLYLGELFARLYALHYVRNRYLEHYRPHAPGMEDSGILTATLGFECCKPKRPWVCPVPPHTVWPLPLPFPSAQFFLHSAPPRTIAYFPQSLLTKYIVPSLDGEYHLAFSPAPVEALFARVGGATKDGKARRVLRKARKLVNGGGRKEQGFIHLD
ncbi:hypothetical protein JCM8097_008396 [Rhodosporidiobolus ruineniae]